MSVLIVKNTSDVKDIAEGFVPLPVARTDGKKGKSGKCVVVPEFSANTLQAILSNEIGAKWIADAINGLRAKMVSEANAKGATLVDSLISMTPVLERMRVEVESTRVTKESIGKWFDSDLLPRIVARIQELMPAISTDKAEKQALGYREHFISLAGRDVFMSEKIKAMLIKALDLLPEDYESVIGNKVAEKLAQVGESGEELIDLL